MALRPPCPYPGEIFIGFFHNSEKTWWVDMTIALKENGNATPDLAMIIMEKFNHVEVKLQARMTRKRSTKAIQLRAMSQNPQHLL